MSKLIAVLVPVTVALWALTAPCGAQADDLMWYRGYFSGQTVEVPLQGFVYRVDPGTVQPAFYYRYRTQPVPLQPLRRSEGLRGGSEARAVRPAPQVLLSPVPLPGQYWYEEPGAYSFQSPVNLGWPYGQRR